jgi:hypothetical protein
MPVWSQSNASQLPHHALKQTLVVIATVLMSTLLSGCPWVKQDAPATATDAAPTPATITITAPNADNLWYAIYYRRNGKEVAMEDLAGEPQRAGVDKFVTLKSCASNAAGDVPQGARPAVYAAYVDSKTGEFMKDGGQIIIECVRGQGARPFTELQLAEAEDDACSSPACVVWKFGVQYCRC